GVRRRIPRLRLFAAKPGDSLSTMDASCSRVHHWFLCLLLVLPTMCADLRLLKSPGRPEGRPLRAPSSARRCASLLSLFTLMATPALAHTTKGVGEGFISGFTHPLTGIAHMLAMVAVGIWGTQLGRPAIWLLPVTFPLVMSFGGVLGVRAVPIPFVEIGVAASAVVLGCMILLSVRTPIAVAAVIVGGFAIVPRDTH